MEDLLIPKLLICQSGSSSVQGLIKKTFDIICQYKSVDLIFSERIDLEVLEFM